MCSNIHQVSTLLIIITIILTYSRQYRLAIPDSPNSVQMYLMLLYRAAEVSALSSPDAHEKTGDMSRQQVQIPCPPMISSVSRGGAESAHPKRI